jgi:hypothetical protein
MASKADLAQPGQGRRKPPGRRHSEWGFSNRMLDTTAALMAAK